MNKRLKGLVLGTALVLSSVTMYFSIPKPHVYVLGATIGRDNENYQALVDDLKTAHRGDQIYIILKNNGGGWAKDGYNLYDDIRASKAIVTTEARGNVSSAALHVLLAGDYIRIPKDNSEHIAHMQFIGTEDHPIRLWFMIQTDKERYPVIYGPFLTHEQWDSLMDGDNVALTGEGICKQAPSKSVDNKEYCVIDYRSKEKHA